MLRAALIGTGNWGARLLAAAQGSDQIRFTMAVTRTPAARQELAEKFGVTLTPHFREALAHPAIEAVVIATPHSQHVAQVMDAAQAKKHVFVEKPLALTRASGERAIAACRTAHITLGVGFNRRFAPAFIEMKRRIAAGAIGKLRFLEGHFSGPANYQIAPGNWRASALESPAGAMTARGCHILDAMVQLAGLVTEVRALSERRQIEIDVDDTTAAVLRFTSGASGMLTTLHASTLLWRLHAFGEKGSLEMRGDTELIGFDLAGEMATPQSFATADKERAILEDFAGKATTGIKFAVAPEEIVNNIAVTEAISASAKSGRAVKI